jgi:pyruvate formate lyase activating enzyme
MALPFYGKLSSLADDPIEKKPLHHFLPGSRVISAGFYGCNLTCPFCQNWEISQTVRAEAACISPAELVASALASGAPSLAFTYSEPTIHFEYLREAMKAAHDAGLKTVLVTNGCLSEAPARDLLALTDAANVDLKCWSAEQYARLLGGNLEAVLGFIRVAAELSRVEVTTLVVPGLSDSPEDVAAIASFLAGISADIPFHLSAYHPAYHSSAPAVATETMEELAGLARRALHYVYVGNLPGKGEDSLCPSCGEALVRRHGYSVEVVGLSGHGISVSCASCGTALPFVLA